MTQQKAIFSPENIIDKDEKIVQKYMNRLFEEKTGSIIIEELKKDILEFEGHGVLILSDLKKGLKLSNRNIIHSFIQKYPIFTESQILDLFLHDFIKKFNNTKTNADKYNLIFSLDEKEIQLKDNNQIISLKYVVLDHSRYEKNIFRIVKEKRIEVNTQKHFEYPDFAIYFNGIPFVAIEVKTIKEGLTKAFKDARTKPSYYRNFLFTIGTTGIEAFIMSNRDSQEFYLFEDYDDNGIKTGNGFLDLAAELIFQPKNLLFYAEFGTLKQKDENGNYYLINARVQQYYALKKADRELKAIEHNDKKLLAYLKHHTRTGKTITFKLIMSKVMTSYIHRFNTIYFFTHDLTVLRTILSEMAHFEFGNKGKLKLIENIREYKNTVKTKKQGIFLVNMQKIEKFENVVNDSIKILILIDEIHTFQSGQLSDIRNKQFPNASYLGATATPNLVEYTKEQLAFIFYEDKKYKGNKKELEEYALTVKKNMTKVNYGKELDNFTPYMAKKLGLVTDLSINSLEWNVSLQIEHEKLELNLNNTIEKELNSKKNIFITEVKDEIKDTSSETKNILNSFKSMTIQEIERDSSSNRLLGIIKRKIEKNRNKLKQKLKKEQRRDFNIKIFKDEINFVTNEMLLLKNSTSEYIPSFFWVVNDISEAMALIRLIKENGTDKKQNIYNGFRFAVDVSELNEDSIHDSDKEFFNNMYSDTYDLDTINGNYIKKDMILDFESQDKGSIDCLILVSKRLMGYDNKELTAVFLDKEIRDIKLITQFVTRPTTMRFGKQCGYVFDLSFKRKGQKLSENLKTLKMAFELYDSENDTVVFFSKEFLDNIYTSLDLTLDKMRAFFVLNGLDESSFFQYKNRYSQKVISLYQDEKVKKKTLLNPYFEGLKDINNLLKQIINPFYQLKKNNKDILLNEISGILDITAMLNKTILNDKLLNDKNYIYYTDKDITMMSREIFETTGKDLDEEILTIGDVMNINIKGKKKEELDAYNITKIQIKSQQNLLNIYSNAGLKDTNVFEYFDKISRTTTLEDAEEAYKKAELTLVEEQNKINEIISLEYDGFLEWYIVDKTFKFHKKISKYYANKIVKEINLFDINIGDYEIERIIDSLDIKSIEFLREVLSKEERKEISLSSIREQLEEEAFFNVIENIVNKNEVYFIKDVS